MTLVNNTIYTSQDFLPVMEIFSSIQGEGFFAGTPAIFIRIAGCDVGCHWCDTKESWDTKKFSPVPVEKIARQLTNYKPEIVVVTGGEPLMYSLDELTDQLKKKGKRLHLETSGAYPLSGQWDWICLSPKKTKPPLSSIYRKADELKIIVFNRHDLVWAEEQAKKVSSECKLFLQPEWGKRKEAVPQVIHYITSNPQWRVSVQWHKYLGLS